MKIILSCTTTNERSEFFYYCLQSLFKQTLQPDLILVNVSKEPYLSDSGFSEMPNWLKDDRITVNWVDNTGPYRKLLPAIEIADEEDLIITADDDILYGKTWIEDLIKVNRNHSDSIVCCRARKMEKSFYGDWKNYSCWNLINKSAKGMLILPTGGAGTVYKKELLNIDFLTDTKFLEIAPTADDLWFRMASLIKDIPVLVFPKVHDSNKFIVHDQGLIYINSKKIMTNSLVLKSLKKAYNLFLDSMGINRTVNDSAWDNILKYSKSKYRYNGIVKNK